MITLIQYIYMYMYIYIYIYIYASETKRYINGFGETKYMSFLIKDE